MNELTYKTEVFEGPLDLLLSLISKNKVDIMDIPIALILEQYMQYIEQMARMDMEIAGEFIVMASELMLIKSKLLLPRPLPEGVSDPRAELALALLEYKYIKESSTELDERQKIFSSRFVKDTDEIKADDDHIRPYNVSVLKNAMLRVLMRVSETKKPQGDNIRPIIKRRIVPVGGKIVFVMKYLLKHGDTHIDTIFMTSSSRSEIVAVFMATLELLKADRIYVSCEDEDTGNCVIGIRRDKHEREVNAE